MTWTLLPATEFAAYADRWAQLNADTGASPLLQPEFVQPLLAELGSGKELLAIYERDGIAAAMAIIAARGPLKWETFQPSQAPMGMWMHRRGADLAAMLEELMRALPGVPLVLGLTQRDPARDPRPAAGGSVSTVDYIETARIRIQGDFDAYWNARGKNLRANMKKQRAKLLKEGIGNRLEIIRDADDVAAAIVDYGKLETTGWKSGIGTAVSADNPQGRFYQRMLEAFCRRGQGCILRYWFDDQVVAMNLCIEGQDCIIVLKTAYDEALSKQYSPAFLMLEETCRQLFEERKFASLEFYGRVMEWHLRWTDEVRTMYHLTGYRWRVLLQLHTFIKNRKARAATPRPPVPAPLAIEQGTPSE
ncbi:MAG TPA: GNAT family N-acetyltransferase [Telluria sp.]|nr:GNAT family N-acetyltransferase [Telluria sp.]